MLNLDNYRRFVIFSTVWTVVLVSLIAVAVTAEKEPAAMAVFIPVFLLVTICGLIVAVPLVLITLPIGRLIVLGVDRVPRLPRRVTVPLSGAMVSLVPLSMIALVSGADFDLVGSVSDSFGGMFVIGASVGAVTAYRLLLDRSALAFE